MKWYIVSTMAYNPQKGDVHYGSKLIRASSPEEAEGGAMQKLKHDRPYSDGWSHHDTMSFEVSAENVRKMARDYEEEKDGKGRG